MTTGHNSLTEDYDVFVGRIGKRTKLKPDCLDGSVFAPEYMRHDGHGDWRDVQAWRYTRRVQLMLLENVMLREAAQEIRGKRLAAPTEHGKRLAGILATVIDDSGIVDHVHDEDWMRGYRDGMDEALPKGDTPSYALGLAAGREFNAKRAQVAGVAENYEDPGE